MSASTLIEKPAELHEADPAVIAGALERVALEEIRVANRRAWIDPEKLADLAKTLSRDGQLVPAIRRRVNAQTVLLYAGHKRLLAAKRSHQLAVAEGFDGLAPVKSLLVLLVGYEPSRDQIARYEQSFAATPLAA